MSRLVRATWWSLALMAAAEAAPAQESRDTLTLGIEAYLSGDLRLATGLLQVGLNPRRSAPDSLRYRALATLGSALIEDGKDEIAELWLRWALRLYPRFGVDTVVDPPPLTAAFARAQRATVGQSVLDSNVTTAWLWGPASTATEDGGLIVRTNPAQATILLEGSPARAAENRLPPGTYSVQASADGFISKLVRREVLAGVTTVLDFRLSRAPLAAPGMIYVASVPWGSVYVDGQRIGYTAIAAYPVAPGTHRLRIESEGYIPFDTTLTVQTDQRLRLGTIRLRPQQPGGRQ